MTITLQLNRHAFLLMVEILWQPAVMIDFCLNVIAKNILQMYVQL